MAYYSLFEVNDKHIPYCLGRYIPKAIGVAGGKGTQSHELRRTK